jgi:hypothetical protein
VALREALLPVLLVRIMIFRSRGRRLGAVRYIAAATDLDGVVVRFWRS